MNGKCVAYCSLLVFAVLIKTSSSNPRCNTKDQQHYCVTAIRENCTCADIKRPCSAEGLECPNRKTPQCYQRKTGSGITPEISCSCSCL
uniref:Dermacentor 9 kDa family member n=1 Tax=Rhipicephalus appendiculatus TaxID=34631 RepID=A0A131Z986_RHIAP